MGFDVLDAIVRTNHSGDLSGLIKLSLGVGDDVDNPFTIVRRLRQSRPMLRCLSRLLRAQARRQLIESPRPVPPDCLEDLLPLAKGTPGHSFAEIAQVLHDYPSVDPKPDFVQTLETDVDEMNDRALASHDIHHDVSGLALNRPPETAVLSLYVQQFAPRVCLHRSRLPAAHQADRGKALWRRRATSVAGRLTRTDRCRSGNGTPAARHRQPAHKGLRSRHSNPQITTSTH
jgi:hypothetical protein